MENFELRPADSAVAENPNHIRGEERVAFGRSGKGRHGAFCFADGYEISTRKEGHAFTCRVERVALAGYSPFRFAITDEREEAGHGTTIRANVLRNFVPEAELREIIGTKFSIIPSFQIFLNRQPIQLLDIKHLQTTPLQIDGVGEVIIHQIDSETRDRTMQLRGICWWVKRRAVGNPMEGLDGGAYLDGRGFLARRYSFVVEADVLERYRKPDWTGFFAGAEVNAVRTAVHRYVIQTLNELQSANRKERKMVAFRKRRAPFES